MPLVADARTGLVEARDCQHKAHRQVNSALDRSRPGRVASRAKRDEHWEGRMISGEKLLRTMLLFVCGIGLAGCAAAVPAPVVYAPPPTPPSKPAGHHKRVPHPAPAPASTPAAAETASPAPDAQPMAPSAESQLPAAAQPPTAVPPPAGLPHASSEYIEPPSR
jgi:hypothetical protein